VKFQFEWLVEDQVCKVVMPEDFKDEIFEEYDRMLVDVLDRMTHKIHLVADLRAVKTTANMTQARKLKHPFHPNMGRVLMIGLQTNPIVRFLASFVAQVAGVSYKSFSTYEEAVAYLERMEGIQIPSQT
jgi:hypothetical protein